MDAGNPIYAADLMSVVERIMSTALDEPVAVGAGYAFADRTTVFRFPVVARSAQAPTSVVVKLAPDWQPYDPATTAFPAPAWFLFNNRAGTQFLHTACQGTPLSPRFYGGDRAAGLLVVEDLGDGDGLHDVLQATASAPAEASLVQLAALLGRMHAQTIGREAEFNQLRDALGPDARTEFYSYAWMADAWAAAVATLDVSPAPGWQRELQSLIATMRDPGPFLAYTHGDPCPDNVRRVQDTWRLIDFDVGAYRHALTDGVYGRIHFPTCWCVNRLPLAVPAAMEQAYRAELVQGCPAAGEDDEFYRAVVDACVFWAVNMFEFTPLADLLVEDKPWGIATLRQRYLLRLPIVARLTAEHGHLEALGTTLSAMAARLQTVWPDAADELPMYAAFR